MKIRLAVVVCLALGLLAAWTAPNDPAAAEPAVVKAPAEVAPPAPTAVPPVAQPFQPGPPLPDPVLAARALASAQTTVQTQLSLLGDNQYELFVQTFAEGVRPQITRGVFDACRVRVEQVPVKPDWEVAEETPRDGRRVVSVSMFGKSATPFEETGGRWLADAPWCLPVGLP